MDQMTATFDPLVGVSTAMKAYSSADAIACLRAAGVPVTHQRIEIARALFSAPVHLSADQIWANVREQAPDVKVFVGGAVITAEYAEMVGADYYCKDAAESAKVCGEVLGA